MEEPLPTYTDSPRVAHPASTATSPDGPGAGVSTALARFEYEAEKTSVQDATKVLLIEWEEEHGQTPTDRQAGEWTVEWKGVANKREGITLKSQPSSATSTSPQNHRLYFLLQPGAPVPSSVSISYTPTSATNPTIAAAIPTLPAIFPPSLLTSGTSLGKKGVLHTLWAKSRLAALRAEIGEEEDKGRFEGIGVEMARDELEWIKEHFGISEKSQGVTDAPSSPRREYHELQGEGMRGRETAPRDAAPQLSPPLHSPTNLPSPSSATSPSARLQEKMKGLRVGTSPSSNSPTLTPPTSASSATTKTVPLQPQAPPGIMTPPQTGSSNTASKNPLSPEVGDVAVGSRSLFAALKGPHPAENESSQPTPPAAVSAATTTAKRPIAVAPPPSQGTGAPSFGGMSSLDGVAAGVGHGMAREDEETEDGLFALPMSPRSPEMETSPFSFEGTMAGGR